MSLETSGQFFAIDRVTFNVNSRFLIDNVRVEKNPKKQRLAERNRNDVRPAVCRTTFSAIDLRGCLAL